MVFMIEFYVLEYDFRKKVVWYKKKIFDFFFEIKNCLYDIVMYKFVIFMVFNMWEIIILIV